MKKIVMSLFAFPLFMATAAQAASITVAWDPDFDQVFFPGLWWSGRADLFVPDGCTGGPGLVANSGACAGMTVTNAVVWFSDANVLPHPTLENGGLNALQTLFFGAAPSVNGMLLDAGNNPVGANTSFFGTNQGAIALTQGLNAPNQYYFTLYIEGNFAKMVYTRTTALNPTCSVALNPNNFDCGSATQAHIRVTGAHDPDDTTPPVITPTITGTPGLNGWYTSAVTVAWNVSDEESDITASSGCGTTTLTADTPGATLTCTATSEGGGSSNTVTIKMDRTPPTITCDVVPTLLWPPNHKLVNVAATVNVADALSGSGTSALTSVTSNEPDSGLGGGDVPDDLQGWTTGAESLSGQLRAERSDAGSGRIYTLSYRGTDNAGNIARCNAIVSVPHDARNK